MAWQIVENRGQAGEQQPPLDIAGTPGFDRLPHRELSAWRRSWGISQQSTWEDDLQIRWVALIKVASAQLREIMGTFRFFCDGSECPVFSPDAIVIAAANRERAHSATSSVE